MLIRKSFRYRIYPTPGQAERLARWDGALRFLWNLALEQRLHAYSRCRCDRKYPTAFDQINELAELREMLPWLAGVPRDVCAQLLVELDKAWQRCFKRIADAPRWKRKGRDRSPIIEPHLKAFRLETNSIVFPKLVAIHAVLHRAIEGTPKTCAITRDADAWFAAVSCEVEIADPIPSTKPAVAIDRGVTNLIADSNGRVVPNQKHAEKLQKRIARAQRTVARRKKGSKNQQKVRLRVARLQRKARWQRDAVLHRESLYYAKNHGTVVVERLNIRGMTRSAKGTVEEQGTNVAAKSGLNRSLHGAAMGKVVQFLAYKLPWHGGTLVDVPAAYSSQTCAECGVIDAASRRGQIFECVACGHHANADVNAAKVLLSRGTHGSAGCGGSPARGAPVKQQLRVARRGTRREQPGLLSSVKATAFTPG